MDLPSKSDDVTDAGSGAYQRRIAYGAARIKVGLRRGGRVWEDDMEI